ncbi:VirD4-like conjugal transfer protein, CD1115 family [Bacillus xiapuensis]|uniref:Type IV secretory system conjugative DNA transfer family protein n=1 Tax=Bacillus xiapuensis TaxID=2014075 RepID=A0ABU6N656_9BACI|nr:type IV secretory system conjugative DNA transfer family protein [Bacillus xiapuensis]
MEITKETKNKIKRSAIVAGLAGGASQYIAASIVKDFPLVVNYKFGQFWEALNYNVAHPISTISNALSNEAFTHIQPFLIGGTLLLAWKVLFQKNNKYEDASSYGAYGTSRWANDSEIFNPSNITTKMENEGSILGLHKGKMIIQHKDSHLNKNSLIVGGAGAGKTTGKIIPDIIKQKEKSIVVIDPKGELYEKTSQTKRDQGYEVRLVNFLDRDKSDRYNLFDYLRRDSDAFKVADSLVNSAAEGMKVKKDFWNQAQIAVLQALMLYVKYKCPKEEQHMGSVYNLASASLKEIYLAFQEFDKNHVVYRAYATAIERLLGNEKTLSDVFQTLLNTLNPWQYDDICKFTSANDFLFEELGTKKMIVYVILPVADNEFKPLITTFFTQMFSELYRAASLNQGVLPKKVLLLLDEFANVGKIPNFEERLSTCRSLGIEVSIVLQDTSQLERVYGKEIAKEILNNCDIKILLKANEYETAKYFSNLAGKTTIKVKNNSSSSGSKSSSKSESNNYVSRDLITPDEIMKIDFNDELLFMSGSHPAKVKKAFYFKTKAFKDILGKEVSRDLYPVVDRGEYKAFYPAPEPQQEEFELFVPYENEDGKTVDTETGEILEELSPPDFSDEDVPPEEEQKKDELADMMANFKF